MERNILTLAKWLVTRGHNHSAVEIQKLLFFIRVEELKSKDVKDSFFKDNHNFQAWIYGPVNYESFNFLKPFFNKFNEIEDYLISDEEKKLIDDKYKNYLDKYKNYTIDELINESHKNVSWINARAGIPEMERCTKFMEENGDFIRFVK